MSDERTRWSLFHTGHHVVCTEHAAPGGLEVRVSYNNLPIAVQRYAKAEDAAEWAEQVRSQWECVGQVPDSIEDSPAVARSAVVAAMSDEPQPRPFSWGLGNSNTLLHASATPSWFGLQRAWRAFS